MSIVHGWKKAKRKIWLNIVDRSLGKRYYLLLYKSYWHFLLKGKRISGASFNGNFLTAYPNPGAGIGHQASNILAGMVLARELNMTFAYNPIGDADWNCLLGLGEHEIMAKRLLENNFKLIRLPKFNEDTIETIRAIIGSYHGKKVVFRLEQDQFCKEIYKVKESLHIHFCRNLTTLFSEELYQAGDINVAVHVRRGDIAKADNAPLDSLTERWLDNAYYIKALEELKRVFPLQGRTMKIFVFSQGNETAFSEFQTFSNVKLMLDTDPISTFIHLTRADILLTSLSSFSFIAGLYSKGLKVCPAGFWHSYPDSPDWKVMDSDKKQLN